MESIREIFVEQKNCGVCANWDSAQRRSGGKCICKITGRPRLPISSCEKFEENKQQQSLPTLPGIE